MMTNKVVTTVLLSKHEHEFLRTFAYEQHLSINKIFRALVNYLIDNPEIDLLVEKLK